jgi:multiple sugar transport system substrate-binding protein
MKKTMLAGLALLLSASLVFANGGQEKAPAASASGGTAAASGQKKVTIEFANHMILEEGTAKFWNDFKTKFEAANPNISIVWKSAPYTEIANQVITWAGGGDRVDLMLAEVGWLPKLVDAGLAVDAQKVLGADYINGFYPNVMESYKINGTVYGVPLYISPYVLFYNKDILKKAGYSAPPKTYDEMLAMAPKIAALKTADGNKIYPFGQTTASVAISGSSITGMIYNFGGRLLSSDGKLSIDNAGFKDAVTMLQTLDQKGWNPQNAKLKDLRNLFALGQLAMYYDQSWGYSGVQAINPKAAGFTATAVPLAGGSGKGQSILNAHSLVIMSKDPAKQAAVATLVKYLITANVLSNFMTQTNPAYPARKDMADMPAIANSSILKGGAASVGSIMSVPSIPQLDDLNLDLCTLAQNVTVKKMKVDAAIAQFRKSANELIAQN